MNKKILTIVLIVVLLLVGAGVFFGSQGGANTAPASTPTTDNTSNANPPTSTVSDQTSGTSTAPVLMKSTGQLFANSRYASNAYEVYPTLDPQKGAAALSGFALQTQNLGNGVTRVTLAAKQSNYHTQSFIIGAGQKLYFIERSFGDDFGDQDENYGDDMGIAVDAEGHILQ
jgi:hypothetical protein